MKDEFNTDAAVELEPQDERDGKEAELEKKPMKLLKGHWKRYNPFEPSKYFQPSENSKNLLQEFESQTINTANRQQNSWWVNKNEFEY